MWKMEECDVELANEEVLFLLQRFIRFTAQFSKGGNDYFWRFSSTAVGLLAERVSRRRRGRHCLSELSQSECLLLNSRLVLYM